MTWQRKNYYVDVQPRNHYCLLFIYIYLLLLVTYTPFWIIAMAHSLWTLCEHGRIWQPLNVSCVKNRKLVSLQRKHVESSLDKLAVGEQHACATFSLPGLLLSGSRIKVLPLIDIKQSMFMHHLSFAIPIPWILITGNLTPTNTH